MALVGKWGKCFQRLLYAGTSVFTAPKHTYLLDLSLTAAARISPGKGLKIQSVFYNDDVRAHRLTKLDVRLFRKNELGIFPKEG